MLIYFIHHKNSFIHIEQHIFKQPGYLNKASYLVLVLHRRLLVLHWGLLILSWSVSYFKFLSKQLSVSKIPKLQNIYLFLEITTLKQNLTLQITLYIRQIKSFL